MTKRAVNPEDLSPPVGFAHAWLVESGNGDQRTLYLAGQCGYDSAGCVESQDIAAQLDRAMANIAAIRDAEMTFADVVQLNYVTSRNDYATARKEFGRVAQHRQALPGDGDVPGGVSVGTR